MATILQLLGGPAAIRDVATALPEVEALAGLALRWRDLALTLKEKGEAANIDDPQAFAAFLVAALPSPQVVAAFSDLGLGALHTDLASLVARLADPQDRWGRLIAPVSAFLPGANAAFSLPLVDLKAGRDAERAEADADEPDWHFTGETQAGLEVDPGALWPFPAAATATGLIRIAATGGMAASAGATIPFPSFGTAEGRAGSHADAQMDLFYRPATPETSVAAALLAAIPTLPDPFDLDSLSRAMDEVSLEGLSMRFSGEASAGLSLAVGKDFAIADMASGRLAISADLSFRREANWCLSLHRGEDGAIDFAVSRDRESEAAWAVGAGLTIDPSPLIAHIHAELIAASGSWGERLDTIKPYLSPTVLLRGVLHERLTAVAGDVLKDESVRRVLAGEVDTAAALENRLADAFTVGRAEILRPAEEVARTAIDRLLAQLPEFTGDEVRPVIEGALTILAGDAKTAFDAQLSRLFPDAGTARKVSAELKHIKLKVDDTLGDVERAAQGVRDLVGRFDGILRQLVDATADGAKFKIAARIGWDGGSSTGSSYEVKGRFTANNAEARALWRDLSTGRFASVQRLFGAPPVSGITIDPASALGATAASRQGFAADFLLLDMRLSVKDIISASTTIRATADGHVSISGESTASHEVGLFGETRSCSFVSMWDLIRRKGNSGVAGSMALSLGLDHDDDDITPEEMTGLFAGCAARGLIGTDRTAAADAIYADWRKVALAKGSVPQGKVSIRMALPPIAIDRMLALGRRLRGKDGALNRTLFTAAIGAMTEAGYRTPAQIASDVRDARRDFTGLDRLENPAEIMFRLRDARSDLLHVNDDISYYRAFHASYPAFLPMIRRANAFGSIIDLMSQIVDAVPRENNPDIEWAWTADQYRQVGTMLAKASSEWLEVNARMFTIRDALSPLLLAFMDLLARFANPAEPTQGPEALLAIPTDAAWASPLFTLAMTPRGGRPVAIT